MLCPHTRGLRPVTDSSSWPLSPAGNCCDHTSSERLGSQGPYPAYAAAVLPQRSFVIQAFPAGVRLLQQWSLPPPFQQALRPHVHRWTVTSQWCVPVRTPLGAQWIRQTQSERESKRLKQTEQTPATELAGLQATNPASFSGLSCHRCLPGYTIAGQWNQHAYSGTPALDAGTAACLVATGYSLITGLSLQQELDNSRLVFEPI